jgi:hypothetical protein
MPVPPETTVTVPWSIPVGTAWSPAAAARRITSSGTASVEMSMSVTACPRSAFRTQPPTKKARCPARLQRVEHRLRRGRRDPVARDPHQSCIRSASTRRIRAVAPQM